MNGLVVRTMGFTGYARLNSNKDANNHSHSCGQGCESWPFTGEGTKYRCRRCSNRLFRWQPCQIPPMTLCSSPMSLAKSPVTVRFQANQNKWKMSALPSSLCTTPQFPPLTPTPKRSGYSAVFSLPDICNLTSVWKRTPAVSQAIDQEALLKSWEDLVSMKPWEMIG